MTKQLSLPQLPQAWSNTLIALAAVYVVYQLSQGLKRMDETARIATKPIGSALSDLTALANGNHRVENTPLIIQPWYLNNNQITDEAWRTLYKIPSYQPLLDKLFDGRTLKPEYRDIIGRPIGDL